MEKVCERHWQGMSIPERETLLGELAEAIHLKPGWWSGMTIEAIAQIPSFDSLPGDLRGRLFLAVTDDGFSVAEHERASRLAQ
jgi:hypothetical protein